MKRVKIVLFVIIAITPLILYITIFDAGLSTDESKWGIFGSYIGGVYGVYAFIGIAISIYMTNKQFQIQYEDEVFYKSMESLQTRIQLMPKESQDESAETSIAKAVVETINKELENKTPEMALKVLRDNPNLIPDINLSHIVKAANLKIKDTKKQFSDKQFLDEINARQDSYERWNYIKYTLDVGDFQSIEIKNALMYAGYTSFYHAGIEHRKLFYEHAWGVVNKRYSEEINLYIKKLDFILNHIEDTERKNMHKKYLLSHVSKYDIAFLFYYALTCCDLDIMKSLFSFGLLGEVRREECRYLLFDGPSEEKINT